MKVSLSYCLANHSKHVDWNEEGGQINAVSNSANCRPKKALFQIGENCPSRVLIELNPSANCCVNFLRCLITKLVGVHSVVIVEALPCRVGVQHFH